MSTAAGPETLAEAIRAGARRFADTRFVVASDVRPRETELGALVAEAERVAGALQAHGVQAGDVVAIQLPNWYEGAIAQAAAALAGAVVLPIVQIYGPREVGFILRESRAKLFVLPGTWRGRYYPDMLGELGELPGLAAAVVVDDARPPGAGSGEPGAPTVLTWDELATRAKPFAEPVIDSSSLAAMVYTSGTTADPKGVQHTNASVLAEVMSHAASNATGPGTSHLAVFPSGHIAGFIGLLRMLVHGSPTVTMDQWDIGKAARLVDEYQVTYTSGAPVHLAGMLDAKERGEASLASLSEYLVGGASVPPSLVARADAAGVIAYRCYGSSEHPTISTGVVGDSLQKRSNTDGRVIAGNEVRIIDAGGNDVAAGVDGQVVTRGAELFAGYRDDNLNADAFGGGGWFHTGDIGNIDADGYLTITDRMKDIIVRGGENISSKEVEDVLSSHPRVAEVAAVGAPDERYGERVAVFVILREGTELTIAEVGEHFRAAGVARQKTPESVFVVDSLPRTAAGKVQKFGLRERLKDGAG